MEHNDDFLGSIARANIDAFLADCRTAAGQADLAKSVRDLREAEEVDHAWAGFVEDLELSAATGGRVGAPARLRSERPDPGEPVWRPGNPDVNFGLEKSGDRRKSALRHWFASQLALGKSAIELIQHAERHDFETANLLRELAAEVESA